MYFMCEPQKQRTFHWEENQLQIGVFLFCRITLFITRWIIQVHVSDWEFAVQGSFVNLFLLFCIMINSFYCLQVSEVEQVQLILLPTCLLSFQCLRQKWGFQRCWASFTLVLRSYVRGVTCFRWHKFTACLIFFLLLF